MKQIFVTQREHQTILLNGRSFSREEIVESPDFGYVYQDDTYQDKEKTRDRCRDRYKNSEKDWDQRSEIFRFLQEWFDEKPTLTVNTSGSTGVPKIIEIEKDKMIQSAFLTCSFFNLRPLDSTLLCMPLQYIGAKMLIVRSLVAGLNLHYTQPSTHPLLGTTADFTFVPMTPQQVLGCFETPKEENRLRKIKHLLLGGMAVSAELQKKLADFPHGVWSSYGMTETLSHIALRKINGEDATNYFTPFKDVDLSLSKSGTLCIHAPKLSNEVLSTTDIAEILPNGSFRILGRADNVINSGGIKIQIEEIENALQTTFDQAFQLTALPDAVLGERLILLVEEICPDWEDKCAHLPKHKKPKQIIIVPKLPLTESGKPNRVQARELARETAQKLTQ